MRANKLRHTPHPTAGWRLRAWPGDPNVAHLITEHTVEPSTTQFERALELATARGARAVRTSALFPTAALNATRAGFGTIDTLALLRLDLDEHPPPATVRHRCRPLRRWQYGTAADLDRLAFGSTWGNTATSIAEIVTATPSNRSRWVRADHSPAGFAITGRSGSNGYLQRVGVHPERRRRGIARALVGDALNWLHASAVESVLVNTGVGNHAALDLYESFGFESTGQVLTIGECDLTERADAASVSSAGTTE